MSTVTTVGRELDLSRPGTGEYAPHYAPYIARVTDGDIRAFLGRQGEQVRSFLASIPERQWAHRYADGKWSVREVVGHVIDTERIMSYRALRFARGDTTPLAGFEESAYAPASGAEERTMADLAEEFTFVRSATICLAQSLPNAAWMRGGIASGANVTVRGLFWIIAGHAEHHLHVLRERYLR